MLQLWPKTSWKATIVALPQNKVLGSITKSNRCADGIRIDKTRQYDIARNRHP